MPANITPIYTKEPHVTWVQGMSGGLNSINLDTTHVLDTDFWLLYTAGTNGSYLNKIVVKVQPGTNSSATVMRVWLNDGTTDPTTSAAASALIGELGLPSTTNTATAALPDFTYPLNVAIGASQRIYISFGTDPGTCSLTATMFAGKY